MNIIKSVNSKALLGILISVDGEPLSGLNPTIEIRRFSDGLYFDFSAIGQPYWVSSGGAKLKILPESTWQSGFYYWMFDHSIYDPDKIDDYIVFYRNPSPYRLIETEVLSFDNIIPQEVSKIRKTLTNKQTLHAISSTKMIHTIYEDDQITVHRTADISLNALGDTEIRVPL